MALINPAEPGTLHFFANEYGSDKGSIHLERHQYTRIYDRLFADLKTRNLRILELGLLHTEDPRWLTSPNENPGAAIGSAAPSLQMWSSYFPNASIWGFDINDFSSVSIDRATIARGDASRAEDLGALMDVSGGSFDIIVDDASHHALDQQIALGHLFNALNPGGLYIIEDLHWQDPRIVERSNELTITCLRAAKNTRQIILPHIGQSLNDRLNEQIADIDFHDSLEPNAPNGGRDALAVISKKL